MAQGNTDLATLARAAVEELRLALRDGCAEGNLLAGRPGDAERFLVIASAWLEPLLAAAEARGRIAGLREAASTAEERATHWAKSAETARMEDDRTRSGGFRDALRIFASRTRGLANHVENKARRAAGHKPTFVSRKG